MQAEQWANYVREVTKGDGQSEIARRTGIHQTTISRWLTADTHRTPRIETIIPFARAYKINVVDALVAAGVLTSAEGGVTADPLADLSALSTAGLLRELQRRTKAGAA